MINKMNFFNVKGKLLDIFRISRFQSQALSIVAFISLMVMVGCATNQAVRLPAVGSNPNGDVYVGKFVWIDLLTEDVSAASRFYNDLFGWRAEISKMNKDYNVFLKGDKLIGGMIATENQNKEAPESIWLVSLSVDNVDRAASLISERGGKILDGPLDADGRGRMVLVSDPTGASLILLRATGGDPADTKAGTGEWFWTDLFTKNAKNAGDFYSSLAGYQVERVEVKEDHQYDVLKRDGHLRAGIVELPWKGLEDNWLPYFKVDDVDRTVERARQLWGRLILKSENVAILSDPTGAVFGIQMIPQRRSK